MITPNLSVILYLPEEVFYPLVTLLSAGLLIGSVYVLVFHKKYEIDGKYFFYYIMMAIAGIIGFIIALSYSIG